MHLVAAIFSQCQTPEVALDIVRNITPDQMGRMLELDDWQFPESDKVAFELAIEPVTVIDRHINGTHGSTDQRIVAIIVKYARHPETIAAMQATFAPAVIQQVIDELLELGCDPDKLELLKAQSLQPSST